MFIALCIAGTLTATAFASSVSLDPSAVVINEDDVFTVDLIMDASTADVPGTHPGLFSGTIVIDYDRTLVQYDGFAINSPAKISSGPTVTQNGSQETVNLGFFDFTAPGDTGVIGTFSFTALGSMGNFIDIGLADGGLGAPLFSSFANLLPTNQKFSPTFTGTTVEIVPVPAAAWLMMSGLGVLGLGARRRRS